MIVENHDVKQGQKGQDDSQNSNRLVQRGVKHGLSDPHAQENEHLDQVEVQGLEHMVVADHDPKKGMALQLKPQFNPLFFPFAMCLPNISTPWDYDLKTGHNITLKAHSLASPIGRESDNNQNKLELSLLGSSKVDMMSTDPIESKLTSPWPDQWRLEGLDNDMTNHEDPWPDLEGTNAWNNASDKEEPDPTDNTPYATPWGLFGEPRWITELNNTIELEPEEDLSPLTLYDPNKDNESTLEGELSPQTSNDILDQKEILSLQNDAQYCATQCDKECLSKRNPENKPQVLRSWALGLYFSFLSSPICTYMIT